MTTVAVLLLAVGLLPAAPAEAGDDLSRLRAAHRARPDDPQVTRALGLLLYQRDNASDEAQGLLEVAARALPGDHGVQLALLDSYVASGNLAGARTHLARLQPALDADERFALDATYCLMARRRFPEARDQWNRVARRVQEDLRSASGRTLAPEEDRRLQRRVAEILFVQGLLTARLGDKKEALGLLGQADGYGFPPLDSPLMMVAADCLSELREYSLAAQAYQEIVKHAPANDEARLRLGVALYSAGQLGRAREELEGLLRRKPDFRRAHYYLGAVLFEQRQTEEARTHLERELARDGRCAPCMAKLAHLAYLGGDDEACKSWLAKSEAADPDDFETNLVFGMLWNRTGQYERAIERLVRVVAKSPDSIRAQYQLALAYQRSGDVEKAREHREIYDRLIQEQKARTMGVRGAQD